MRRRKRQRLPPLTRPPDRGPFPRSSPGEWRRDRLPGPSLSPCPSCGRRKFSFVVCLRWACNRGFYHRILLLRPVRRKDRFGLQSAKILDRPLRLDAGFRRHQLAFVAAPIRFDSVATVAIDALLGEFGGRKRGILRELEIRSQFSLDACVDSGLFFFVPELVLVEVLLITGQRVPRLPVLEHLARHILRGIVLRVAQHAHRLCLDQHWAIALTRPPHCLTRDPQYRNQIIAIHRVAGDPVRTGAIGKITQGHLPVDRRGIRPLIILEDNDKRCALHRRQIHTLMKSPSGCAAIADPGHGHDLLSQIASRHGYAGHYRDEIAQHGNRRDHVARLQIAKMASAVLALCRRGGASHVLRHDVSGFESAYKERTYIANQRRDPITFRQGIGCGYRSSFLSQASVQATDDFVLAEKTNQEFIERAIEPHKVVELERFLAFQFWARRVGFHELSSYCRILKVAARTRHRAETRSPVDIAAGSGSPNHRRNSERSAGTSSNPKVLLNPWLRRAMASARVTEVPSSFSSDVTRQPAMPHGVIRSKRLKSVDTL